MSALGAIDGTSALETTSQLQAVVMRQMLDAQQVQAQELLKAMPAPAAPAAPRESRGSIVDVYA